MGLHAESLAGRRRCIVVVVLLSVLQSNAQQGTLWAYGICVKCRYHPLVRQLVQIHTISALLSYLIISPSYVKYRDTFCRGFRIYQNVLLFRY